jgi:REase_MTES_1575/AAA domain/Protein of unknown function (DUF4011)
MFSMMHQYKLRLTNLSQANRSLKLQRLSVRKDMDLMDLSFLNQLSATDILNRLIAGQNVPLIKGISPRNEQTNLTDRRLNMLWNEVDTIYEESGTDDLFLGYPFVEGRFLDGSVARCPVVLFPVRLKRDFSGGTRWSLEPNNDEDLCFNTTFFLAYEKFMQVRLKREFWETRPEREGDLQGFLNTLYKQITDFDISVHFNSELFQFRLERFPDKNQTELEQLPLGRLMFLPHAVLGVFPQSDSALMQDYEVLEREALGLESYFPSPGASHAVKPVREADRYYVAPVDQSQEEALLRVRAGESIVLHGPPGTGKSQVILNLISDALARGQKVLVCSQKRAALDVVFHRMNEVGLGRFAALVHDYRSDRNKIYRQIRQQIDEIEKFQVERKDMGLEAWMRDFGRDSDLIEELNTYFETVFNALRTPGKCRLSPHELYQLVDRNASRIGMRNMADHFDHHSWQVCRETLANILNYAHLWNKNHPWRNRLPLQQLGFDGKQAIVQQLRKLTAAIDAMYNQWQTLSLTGRTVTHARELPGILSRFAKALELSEQPGAKVGLALAVADKVSPGIVAELLGQLGRLIQKVSAFKILEGPCMRIHPELSRQLETFHAKRKSLGRLVSPSWLESWCCIRKLLPGRQMKLDEGALKALAQELHVVGQILEIGHRLKAYRFLADMPMAEKLSDLQSWHARKVGILEFIKVWNGWRDWKAFKPRVVQGVFDESTWKVQIQDAKILQGIHERLKSFEKSLENCLHPRQVARLAEGFSDPIKAKHEAETLLETIERDYDDICQLDAMVEKLPQHHRGVLAILEPFIGSMGKNDLLNMADQGIWSAWLSELESLRPDLLSTSDRHMPQRLETYRQLVSSRTATVAGLIQRKLKDAIVDRIECNRLGNPVTYREIGHQVRKQRRLWPLRKLVKQYWEEGLSTLVPCWMASPESVSAIFPMVKNHFDLVIFDEASQCYVEHALPAMLRGRQCVVAGDDRQLPPFDLYRVKADEEEAPFVEDQMPLEVESILDLARNKLAQCKLSWHYRSSERELIDFSNHAFYGGSLNVIPTARPEYISRPPISYIMVNGVWEGNCNRREAEKVIALVEELVMRPDNPTIGIVTFNFDQKELIRTLLEQRLEHYRQTGDETSLFRFSNAMERQEGEERLGIFVKNIENVQGDERDVVIFSIGYARNPAGKLVAHFGLLNQKGGGNRLNVAITRARKKKIIVCSIEPEDLKVEDAKYDGPKLLRSYLAYARAVDRGETCNANALLRQLQHLQPEDRVSPSPSSTPYDDYICRIQQKLEAKGLVVRRNVTDSNFTLDLVVVGEDGSCQLGIECEGRNYFLGRSAKEREVYRPALLERRGWTLHRVWLRNYFLDPDAEIERILSVLPGKTLPSQEQGNERPAIVGRLVVSL